MYLQNGIQSYRRTNVVTADPGKLVIMCYEGAIDNLIIAKQKNAEKKYEEKSRHINKTKDIIDELTCSLDFEKGGLIARNLESLYNYMTRRILHADANRSMDALDEVVGMLRELLSAWEDVFAKPDSETYPKATSDKNQMLQTASI
jgi:flagellar protein FliS